MKQFDDLLMDLNFYDSSVGISPITNTNETIEILNEYNITPIEITKDHVLFSDEQQQYKLYLCDDWKIKNEAL